MTLVTGNRSVAEAKRNISHPEFVRWCAYYKRHPFGPMRDNIHAAYIAWMIAITNSDPRKGKQTKLDDFILDPDRKPTVQSPTQMQAHFRAVATAKGRVINGAK